MFSIAWLRDTGERVLRSVIAAVIAALVLTGPLNLTAAKGLLFVAITAGLTVIKTALAALIPNGPPAGVFGTASWAVDAFERVLATFIEVGIAALLTGGSYDVSGLRTAALAGVGAAVSLLVSLIAAPVPSPISPASLVKGPPRRRPHATPRHDL